MKRKNLLLILVAALVLSAFFVACKADIEAPSGELVDVTFAMDGSRALSATLEDFDPDLYYWKYAAAKNAADTSGLNSGATEGYNGGSEAREAGALWIHEGVSGLSGTVPGFSQGLWDFTLYAYTNEGTSESPVYSLTYLGEAEAVSLVKSGLNKVHVVVSPAPEGEGTLYIGTTTLNPKKQGDSPSVSRFLKVEDFEEHEYAPTSGTTYILPAGSYRVTVTYKASGITYADGMVIATVYPNMTTTVTGSVDELVTYAQFEAERNPDIIFRTAEADGIKVNQLVETGSYTLEDTAKSETVAAVVTATVPKEAAWALITAETTDPSATMSLALNVDTVDSTSTSVTYEIGMTKTITVDGKMPETSDVTALNDYVIATVELSAGLTGVKVTHDQKDMTSGEQWAEAAGKDLTPENFVKYAGTEADPDEDGYFYYYEYTEGTTKKATLYIKTNTFSPFQVTYDGETAGVAEVNGVKYATLKAAVEAAQAGDIVKLLSNAEGAGMSINKSITIDLNGKTYTGTKEPAGSSGTENQLFQLLGGTIVVKNGTLTSTAGSGIRMLIQNYSDLTLDGVTLDGTSLGDGEFVFSNNRGDITITDETSETSIVAPKNGIAFDVCSGWSVYKSTKVTVSGGNINGAIEITDWGSADKVELVIEGGFFAKAIERPEGYQTDKVSISITGGTFAWDPSDYVADGYTALYNEATKLWTVEVLIRNMAELKAFINGEAVIGVVGEDITVDEIMTLNGDKVLYLKDFTFTVSLDSGRPFVFDDGQSMTVYAEDGGGMVIPSDSGAYGLFRIQSACSELILNGGSYKKLSNDDSAIIWVNNVNNHLIYGVNIALNDIDAECIGQFVRDGSCSGHPSYAQLEIPANTLSVNNGSYAFNNEGVNVGGSISGFVLQYVESEFNGVNMVGAIGSLMELDGGIAVFSDNDFKVVKPNDIQSWNATTIGVAYDAEITIKSGSYKGLYGVSIFTTGGKIIIDGGTITGYEGGYALALYPNSNSSNVSTCIINGGTIEGDIHKYGENVIVIDNRNN